MHIDIYIIVIHCAYVLFPDNLLQKVINIIVGRRDKLRYLRLPEEKYSSFGKRLFISRMDGEVELTLHLTMVLTSLSI